MSKPVCFIIMPFGKKKYRPKNSADDTLIAIDFDQVYQLLIEPAVIAANMEPVRADNETVGGIIHKPMFERIIMSEYVVADLTGANANVFYELGIRHAVKPYTTVSVYSSDSELPFDLGLVRVIPYDLFAGADALLKIQKKVTADLVDAKQDKLTDSPIYQLVDGIRFQNSVAHEKTDIFRKRVAYDQELKDALANARGLPKGESLAAIDQIVSVVEPENEETGVLIDIMLSYRSVGAFPQMIAFIENMPAHVRHTIMVQEQYGFALNRLKKRGQAIRILEGVVAANGPSSETYGILGRVYKDLFDEACQMGNKSLSNSYLQQAADTYRKGFEADWRDAYPGINLVTLLALQGRDEEIEELVPVVEYAVLQKLKNKKPDYWDYATLLEIEVIRGGKEAANLRFQQAIGSKIEAAWMFDTTINNLKLISKFRHEREFPSTLADDMIALLEEQKGYFPA